MKKIIIGCCLLAPPLIFAAQTIKVTVTTNDPTAAGIGFSVQGKKSGGAGKSYTGKGPINSTYLFGYRKNSAQGKDIHCGSHVLTKDSYVNLLVKGNKCQSIVTR